jgi:DNA-directed RNA polymerase specialized sigma24 family protein
VGSSVADQLLATLAAPVRETLVLREVQELSYRKIAEVTEVSIGTVMSRLPGHAPHYLAHEDRRSLTKLKPAGWSLLTSTSLSDRSRE